MNKCSCVCHENKLGYPYSHETKCCDEPNGVVEPCGIPDMFVTHSNDGSPCFLNLKETCGAIIHTRGWEGVPGPIFCAAQKPCHIHSKLTTVNRENDEVNEKEEWEKDFISKFFVYKLGGKFPDHVGAEKEAVEFIREVRQRAVEEYKQSLRNAGAGGSDSSVKVTYKGSGEIIKLTGGAGDKGVIGSGMEMNFNDYLNH